MTSRVTILVHVASDSSRSYQHTKTPSMRRHYLLLFNIVYFVLNDYRMPMLFTTKITIYSAFHSNESYVLLNDVLSPLSKFQYQRISYYHNQSTGGQTRQQNSANIKAGRFCYTSIIITCFK